MLTVLCDPSRKACTELRDSPGARRIIGQRRQAGRQAAVTKAQVDNGPNTSRLPRSNLSPKHLQISIGQGTE